VVEVCTKCHAGHQQFGHPIGAGVIDPRNGKPMTCLSCHNAHVSTQKMLLIDNPQRALCVQCHSSDGPSLKPHQKTDE
jgi:predicted CXXCH cytochrome family protein